MARPVSDNYNVWTVTLKPNYHFSDGTRVTAELVATCLQELNDKDSSSGKARASVGVMTVTAVSELVVKIDSERPTHIMDSVLAEWIFTIYYKKGGEYIFTGPYAVDNFDSDHFYLIPNLYYPLAEQRPTLTITKYGNGTALAAAAIDGKVDVGFHLAPENITAVNSAKGVSVTSFEVEYQYMMFHNTDMPQLADVNVRKAIDVAINRIAFPTELPGALPTRSMFPEASPYYSDGSNMAANTSTAAALLEQAGWALSGGKRTKDGTDLAIKLVAYPQRPGLVTLQPLIAQSLTDLGITVTSVVTSGESWKELDTLMAAGEYDLLMWAQHTLPAGDPGSFLNGFFRTNSSSNYAHWSSSSVDSMLDALNAITDKHARVNETKAIQAAILAEAPVSMLVTPTWHVSLSDRVNSTYVPWGSDYHVIRADEFLSGATNCFFWRGVKAPIGTGAYQVVDKLLTNSATGAHACQSQSPRLSCKTLVIRSVGATRRLPAADFNETCFSLEFADTCVYAGNETVSEVLFAKFESSWKSPVYDNVILRAYLSKDAVEAALRDGSLDIAYGVNTVSSAFHADTGEDHLIAQLASTDLNVRNVVMNSGTILSKDKRKFVMCAIMPARQALYVGALKDETPMDTLFDPALPHCGVLSNLSSPEELCASGTGVTAADFTEPLRVLYRANDPFAKAIADAVIAALNASGIPWEPLAAQTRDEYNDYNCDYTAGFDYDGTAAEGCDDGNYTCLAEHHGWDLSVSHTWGPPYDPTSKLWDMTHRWCSQESDAPAVMNMESMPFEEFRAHVRALSTFYDDDERQAQYDLVLTTLHDEAIFLPLTAMRQLAVHNGICSCFRPPSPRSRTPHRHRRLTPSPPHSSSRLKLRVRLYGVRPSARQPLPEPLARHRGLHPRLGRDQARQPRPRPAGAGAGARPPDAADLDTAFRVDRRLRYQRRHDAHLAGAEGQRQIRRPDDEARDDRDPHADGGDDAIARGRCCGPDRRQLHRRLFGRDADADDIGSVLQSHVRFSQQRLDVHAEHRGRRRHRVRR